MRIPLRHVHLKRVVARRRGRSDLSHFGKVRVKSSRVGTGVGESLIIGIVEAGWSRQTSRMACRSYWNAFVSSLVMTTQCTHITQARVDLGRQLAPDRELEVL